MGYDFSGLLIIVLFRPFGSGLLPHTRAQTIRLLLVASKSINESEHVLNEVDVVFAKKKSNFFEFWLLLNHLFYELEVNLVQILVVQTKRTILKRYIFSYLLI